MSNLFIRHFARILDTNLQSSLLSTTPKQLRASLAAFRAKYDLRDYTILHRFPRKDIKTLISLPCPVSDPTANKGSLIAPQQTINSMKNLRLALDIREFKACSKCPLKDSCSFKDQTPESQKANLTDLITALIGFAERDPVTLKKLAEGIKGKEGVEGEKRQTEESSKTEVKNEEIPRESKANTQDSKESLQESKESTQEGTTEAKTKAQESNDSQESAKKDSSEESTKDEESESPESVFKFKYWNSGLKVLDSLSVVLEDLYQNNGLESRRFVNTFLEELSKSKVAQKEIQREHFKYSAAQGKKQQQESDSESGSQDSTPAEGVTKEEEVSDASEEEKPQRPANFRDKRRDFRGKEGNFRERGDRSDRFPRDFENRPERNFSRGAGQFRERDDGKFRDRDQGNNRYQGRPQRGFRNEERDFRSKSWDKSWDNKEQGGYKNRSTRQRYPVSQEDSYQPQQGSRRPPGKPDRFYPPGEIKGEDRFMRDSKREFKKFDSDEKPMNFRKRPGQKDQRDFPVVEKEDMLMRKKGRREGKGNFEFSETDGKKKDE